MQRRSLFAAVSTAATHLLLGATHASAEHASFAFTPPLKMGHDTHGAAGKCVIPFGENNETRILVGAYAGPVLTVSKHMEMEFPLTCAPAIVGSGWELSLAVQCNFSAADDA